MIGFVLFFSIACGYHYCYEDRESNPCNKLGWEYTHIPCELKEMKSDFKCGGKDGNMPVDKGCTVEAIERATRKMREGTRRLEEGADKGAQQQEEEEETPKEQAFCCQKAVRDSAWHENGLVLCKDNEDSTKRENVTQQELSKAMTNEKSKTPKEKNTTQKREKAKVIIDFF